MKTFILFLLTTTALIVLGNYYFEYCINREIDQWLMITASVGMVIVVAFYLRYVVKLLQNILKLK
jgi:hypothetical protein